MNRRRYLTLTGAAATAATAGCLGLLDGSSEAASHIESAAEDIGNAGDEFDAEIDRVDQPDESPEFRTETINEYLDRADEALDEAEETANDDQLETIELFRTVATWIRETTTSLAEFGSGMTEIDAADAYLDSDRYEDASARIETAEEHFRAASQEVTNASATFDTIDVDQLEEFDEIDHLEVAESMDDLDQLVDTMVEFTVGYRHLVDGTGSLLPALGAYDDGDYETAIDGLDEAQPSFRDAASGFRAAEELAPSDMLDDIVDLTCYAESMADAIDHFEASAEAAMDENWDEAAAERDRAEEILDRCE